MEPRTRLVMWETLKMLAAAALLCAILYGFSGCSTSPMTVQTSSGSKRPVAPSPSPRFMAYVDTFTLNKHVAGITLELQNLRADLTDTRELMINALTGPESPLIEIAENTRGFLTITQALTGTGSTGGVGLLVWWFMKRRKSNGDGP